MLSSLFLLQSLINPFFLFNSMNNSKLGSKKIIESYFSKGLISSSKTKKIKKLAMKYRINLKGYRKKFCNSCYSDSKLAKTRISKGYKQVTCRKCNAVNRWKIK